MLPAPYDRWFAEICGRPGPVEARSTCESCAMLAGAPDLPPQGPFDAATRCCTYHPSLAPHFVGAILREGGHGAGVVRQRIAARAGVTPLGLAPPQEWTAAWRRLAADGFGRSRELLCPFHADARCSIWRHRGAACAAFHCKYDRGATGASLWGLLLIAYNTIERALAGWLLGRHGLDAAACDAFLHAPADAALDARAWGGWQGREEEYFCAAAEAIAPLSWAEVAAIGGSGLARLAEALRDAVKRFDLAQPPARVRHNADILVHLGRSGSVRLQNPRAPLDLLEVPAGLANRLEGLQDAPADELGLDPSLLRRLLDWEVLI
ncbi:MAG TPA: hypothetical protein VLW85_17690 [Myxococcales bacterium]|nr:hypothetical protein [Myxococcales bacterium]